MTESNQHTPESNNAKASDARNRQITVNDSMTLMQECRKATLKKGCNIVQAEGVPNNVDISSIMLGIRSEKACRIVSKSFRAAESMNAQRALNELKGTEVFVHYTTPFKLQTYNGILLGGNAEELVLERFGVNGRETMVAKRPEAISSKQRLKNLRELPALEFEIESEEDQEVDLSVLFRSSNSFSCPISHNLVFDDRDEKSVIRSFESSALLSNRSGCDWSDVTIKIMTGAQEREQSHSKGALRMAAMSFSADAMESAGGGAPAESVGERKLFPLPPGISVKNGDSKLIQLLLAEEVPVTKEYYLPEGTYEMQPAKLKLTFKNLACEKGGGLGKSIPAGDVSVYQPEQSGSLQLTAEVPMADSSIGDSIVLELGGTADIKATRRLEKQEETFVDKNRKPLTKKALADLEKAKASTNNRKYVKQPAILRQFFEVSIKNFKDKVAPVVVLQSLSSNQQILKQTAKFDVVKNSAKATVNVPARTEKAAGEMTVTYIVESFYERDVQVGDIAQ